MTYKLNDRTRLLLLLAIIGILSAETATVTKRSVSGWFSSKKQPVQETVLADPIVPDALATGVWKVHRYNGLQLKPIISDVSSSPVEVQPLLDEDIRVEAINDFVSVIPDESLNVYDVDRIFPYVNLIPERSIDTLQFALKNPAIKEKSKLKKLIDLLKYVKQLKLKPIHFIKDKLFGKKNKHVIVPAPSLPAYADLHELPEPVLPAIRLPPFKFVSGPFPNSYINVQPIESSYAAETVPTSVNLGAPPIVKHVVIPSSLSFAHGYVETRPENVVSTQNVTVDILPAASSDQLIYYNGQWPTANVNYGHFDNAEVMYPSASENQPESVDLSALKINSNGDVVTAKNNNVTLNGGQSDNSRETKFLLSSSAPLKSNGNPIYVYPSEMSNENDKVTDTSNRPHGKQ